MCGLLFAVWPRGSKEARQGWTPWDRLPHAFSGLPLLSLWPGQTYFVDSTILKSEAIGMQMCVCVCRRG